MYGNTVLLSYKGNLPIKCITWIGEKLSKFKVDVFFFFFFFGGEVWSVDFVNYFIFLVTHLI